MRLAAWVQRFSETHPLAQRVRELSGQTILDKTAEEARPFLASLVMPARQGPALIITASYERALQWQSRLRLCGIDPDRMFLLPSGLSALFEDTAPESIALSDRIGALKALATRTDAVVIATPSAALERTLSPEQLREHLLRFEVGDSINLDDLARKLQRLGYERAEPVRLPGQFSQRGFVFDIFPTGADTPIRLELFGDELESIRRFDANSQRSSGSVDRLEIAPSRETLLLDDFSGLIEMIEQSGEREAATLDEEAAATLRELLADDIAGLQSGAFFDRLELYRPLIMGEAPCAVDYLGEEGLLILDEPAEIAQSISRADEDLQNALDSRAARGEILKAAGFDFVFTLEKLGDVRHVLAMSLIDDQPDWLDKPARIELGIESLATYRGDSTGLTRALGSWRTSEHVVLSTDQPTRAATVLGQVEMTPQPWPEEATGLEHGFFSLDGNLAGGFRWPEAGVTFITDRELFGVGRLKLPQRKFNEGTPIATILDLSPGDFVVHINFGIGRYAGLVKRESDGVEREYLLIEYKEPDKLYVPADQLDRIQKFLAPGDVEPKLNKLTGGEWQKTIRKAREDAREYARELTQLYAKRKVVNRPPFRSDDAMVEEMERTFPWMETPSQLHAIREVKRDLRQGFPMDRLICGDVGFGKTEIAIRAAFMVAASGRQVAVLCPTTVLSEQHYENFRERLSSFGVNLGLLNRFQTTKQRREVLEGLADGSIHIVVGTHALLGKELKFKDLGLLIIDEEQKFGVKHKESLKSIRTEVDVLAMSATPIPRTLNMAIQHIRQMSLINDPPPGRLPIRSYSRPYGKEVIREALLRELSRGGQVYYVYNRVQGIHHVAERLRNLVPNARVAVGHGQMTEKELEPVMVGFIRGEIDILVSTSIIENGLDISNANTIIVENADRFGLAQLHQMRGRVGRSDRQAYAYFLYDRAESLTENAMARLKSLQEYSALGSGYAIAFRDLQIRGAGDLLGAKQSGQMNTIGYELYTQLIESEVKFLKSAVDEGAVTPLDDPLAGLTPLPSFDLPVTAMIPEAYISEEAQRLYYYNRIMSSRTESELTESEAEVEDRYGRPPHPVKAAFAIMRCRLRAQGHYVEKVDGRGSELRIVFAKQREIPLAVVRVLQRANPDIALQANVMRVPYFGDALTACERFLDTFESAIQQVEAARSALNV